MMRTKRIENLLIVFFVFAGLFWGLFWGKDPNHFLGDAGLSGMFMYAADVFLKNGFLNYGLPVYFPDTLPYTHLTSGPEWVQTALLFSYRCVEGLFGKTQLPISGFQWCSLILVIFTFVLLFLSRKPVQTIVSAVLPDLALKKESWDHIFRLTFLFFLSTAALQVFSPNPYCFGMYLSDFLALVGLSWWAKGGIEGAPTAHSSINEQKAYFFGLLSIFVGFWMGLSPVVLATGFFITGWVVFSKKTSLFQLICGLLLVYLTSFGLKLLQNYLYLGSLAAVYSDYCEIFLKRAGMRGAYSLPMHPIKTIYRFFYFFGIFPAIFLGFYIWSKKKQKKLKGKGLIIGLFFSGILWQILMRQHAYNHQYMLRFMFWPLIIYGVYLLALFWKEKNKKFLVSSVISMALIQFFALWIFVIIPRSF